MKDLGTVLFRWVGLVMVLVAMVVAASGATNDLDWMVNSIVVMQRCLRVMQCGMVLFLLVFIRHLGLTPRSRSFGIAFGFGLTAISEIVLNLLALRSGAGSSVDVLSLVNVSVYNVAIVVWCVYMLRSEAAKPRAASALRTRRWEQELDDIRTGLSGERLIPRFETLVEQALSRAGDEAATPSGDSSHPDPNSTLAASGRG